jgi:hypothetical protein
MRLPALTIAAATALTFAFTQAPVLAQGHDDDAVGPPLRLDGGSPLGSDNRGQSFGGQSQGTERSGAVSSEKSQIQTGKTNETTTHRGSKTHVGLRSRARHYLALHRRSHHVFAFHMPSTVS